MNWHDLFIVVITVITTKAYEAFKKHLAMPFKFTCPECGFKVATDRPSTLELVQKRHASTHDG